MKIEKINDNQIRCTLTKEDLDNHQIRLSELAYGTEKAKKLFRDMMLQAQAEFGFEADNTPLMIEAIPMNTDSLVLIITKVEDPEELDTRFSKFSPYKNKSPEKIHFDGADNILDLIQKLREPESTKPVAEPQQTPPESEQTKSSAAQTEIPVNLLRLYSFRGLDDVIAASHGLNGFYDGDNALYKNESAQEYQLVIHQSGCSPEDFNKICNILSEYGNGRPFSPSGEAHLREHGILISDHAIQQLATL